MMFPAHITVINDETCIQSVKEHCLNTAWYAKESLYKVGLGNAAYLAGILHDFGKYTMKYKQYLEAASEGKKVKRGSVNHTFAAVVYLFERYGTNTKNVNNILTCEVISYAIGAHHGLFDAINKEGQSGFVHRVKKDKDDLCYDEAKTNYLANCVSEEEIDVLFQQATEEVLVFVKKIRDCIKPRKQNDAADATENLNFLTGLLSRLVLSAVINGDRRDTAEFFDGKPFIITDADSTLWKKQVDFLEQQIATFVADTKINKARAYISDACADFEAEESGIYKITVPTGAGKTISMLRFALTQAQKHNKKRIIFIIPLLSVLDQNSKVIRAYLESKDICFEHHSNVVKPEEEGDELDRYELLADTWDAPVIISTLVQLLNILFSLKPSSIRRMQSLCDSVIVIDEVQSVPKKLIYMFNMAINFLAYCTNATIVLSSATQPAFDLVKKEIKFSSHADIVPYSKELWSVFKRTQIISKEDRSFENESELAEYAADLFRTKQSLLIICNTKRSAARVYDSIKTMTDAEVFHLSTSMCMAHRQKVLEEISERLGCKKRIICVSTQLVEAGVDFSFESVIRLEAGLDNIAQAAGRCNRNGESNTVGTVEIVKLKSENISMLREIETSQDCFRRFMADLKKDHEKYENILSPQSVERYFELMFHELESTLGYSLKVDITNTTIFDLLAQNNAFGSKNKNYCINQAFKTAGTYFKVFDDDTFDAIVQYDDVSRILIEEIIKCSPYDFIGLKGLVERAKPYTIHIYAYQREILEESGMLYFDKSGRIMMLNKSAYSADKGLDEDKKKFNLFF